MEYGKAKLSPPSNYLSNVYLYLKIVSESFAITEREVCLFHKLLQAV